MPSLLRIGLAFVLAASVGCVAPPNLGVGCDRAADCSSSLVCRFGRCRAECATNRDCPAGSTCFLGDDGTGACSLDVDLSCGGGTGTQCASGLTCIGGQCVRTCDTAADCPSDGECRNIPGTTLSFCFDMRVPAPDAAAPDDAGNDAFQPPPDAGNDVGNDAGSDAGMDGGYVTPTPPPRDLCIGGGFICAIVTGGEVRCWGDAKWGTLGLESSASACDLLTSQSDDSETPFRIMMDVSTPLSGVDGLGCGSEFACAHRMDGSVVCWGRNELGELAQPTASLPCSFTPVAIDFGTPVATDARLLVAGREACLFEVPTGRMWCWGYDHGIAQSGPAAMALPTPTLVTAPGDAGVARLAVVAPGQDFACAITAWGDPFCWGQSGVGQTGGMGTRPPLVWLRTMTAGRDHVVAIHGSDDIVSWGGDFYDQLLEAPDGSVGPCADAAPCARTYVGPAADHFMTVVSGGDARHTCGIVDTAGHVVCWGENRTLQSGVPDPSDGGASAPFGTHVRDRTGNELVGITSLYVGGENACARDGAGHLWCWGADDRSQLQIPSVTYDEAFDRAQPIVP